MKKIITYITLLCLVSYSVIGQLKKKETPSPAQKSEKKQIIKENTQTTALLQLLAKHKSGSIVLRWSPVNPKVWDDGNQYGYTLQREVIRRDGKFLDRREKSFVKSLVFAGKSQWVALAEKNDYARLIKGYFYDQPIPVWEKDTAVINNALKGRLIFSMLTADLSPEVAGNMALSYVDSTVKANEEYVYTVSQNTAAGVSSAIQAKITAGLAVRIPQFAPGNLVDLDFVDSTVTLKWELSTRTVYTAYHVERSDDDGVTFKRITSTPYLPLGNSANLKEISYIDHVRELHKTYVYRVKGIDPFADESEPSNLVRVYAYQTRLVSPKNLDYSFVNNKAILIKWSFPDSLLINVKGFNLYRNNGDKLEKQNERLISKDPPHFHIAKIKDHDENIIYTVSAVDLREKETFSDPLLAIVIDSIAPAKVTKLKGKIDKKGIVKLSWQPSVDRDVFSYDIYRAEGLNPNDMYMVKQVTAKDTSVIDSVNLRGATRYVYYKVIAADYHTNYSTHNDTIRLVRPDIFPPDPPKFTALGNTDSTVVLNWAASSSEDVVNYKLYKRFLSDSTKKLLLAFPTNQMITTYADKDWEEEKPMVYILEAIDGEGLSSGDSCQAKIRVLKPLRRAAVSILTATYQSDHDNKGVKLQWKYISKKPVVKYLIMRKSGKENDFEKVKDVSGDVLEFVDMKVNAKTEYTYTVYAFFADKTSTYSGKEVKVRTR